MKSITSAVVFACLGLSAVAQPDLAAFRAAWEAEKPRIEADIRANRMSDYELVARDAKGSPLANADVVVEQVSHDFRFGSNCLILGQIADWSAAIQKVLAK